MAEKQTVAQSGEAQTRDVDQFETLLKKSFKPRNDSAASEVNNAVQALVQQALQDSTLVKDDVLDTIEFHDSQTGPATDHPAQ